MAAKKPTRPRKFKQARKDALADAKKDFSGKKQAGLKDRTLKISADDKKALSDVKAEAKGNFITDDRGNKINVKPTETAQERFARDRREAKAAIDRKYGVEDKPAKPAAPAKAEAPTATKPKATKPKVTKKAAAKPTATKPAVKGFSAGKTLTPKGQAVYDDLIKQGVKPKSAMNKAIFRQEKTTASKPTVAKPTAPKPTATKVKAPQVDKLKTLQTKVTAAKTTAKEIPVMRAAKNVSTLSKVLNSPAGKVAKTAAMVLGPGKFVKAGMLVKGALAANKAVKVTKAVKAADAGKKIAAANTARKAANVAKAEKAAKAGVKGKVKKFAAASAGFYALGKLPDGSEKSAATKTLPQRPAGQYPKGGGKGMKLGPNVQVNAGGSTTSYTVKKGDTLSGIAKTSGAKLSEILAANPKIADKKSKYKGGNMIWSGTKVKLPTKK
jgi:nucleoid-associated protein YgaU